MQKLCQSSSRTLHQLGFSETSIAAITQPDWHFIEKIQYWSQHPNHHLLTLSDPSYPALLREISDPPFILYVDGNPTILNTPQIAVVGSRKATQFGKTITYQLVDALCQAQFTITSGLARGIDAAGHTSALHAQSPTIAVLGTGIDVIYPHQHRDLSEKIREKGAIISELPLSSPPKPFHFPRRNRIISGLSLATLVVEAGLKSGSLITARLAAEQGRDVFAIPGSISNPLTAGCHFLIQQGAKLITSPEDILSELPLNASRQRKKTLEFCFSNQTNLDKDHQKLLECIGFDMLKFEQLVDRTGFSTQKVSVMLCNLILNGYIREEISGYLRATL